MWIYTMDGILVPKSDRGVVGHKKAYRSLFNLVEAVKAVVKVKLLTTPGLTIEFEWADMGDEGGEWPMWTEYRACQECGHPDHRTMVNHTPRRWWLDREDETE